MPIGKVSSKTARVASLVSNQNRPARQVHRNHQFDFLRILFATLVILAHAPELTDGNNSREIFSRLTHSNLSFGALGVDGFFLLSGYLIVNSWQKNPELLNFARNRLLRILPGYLVAALLSTVAIGLLAPGIDHFFRHLNIHFVKSVLVVSSPSTPSIRTSLLRFCRIFWPLRLFPPTVSLVRHNHSAPDIHG
jgi:peptidoglycan/LPS O-acetylase OafA/YrhL